MKTFLSVRKWQEERGIRFYELGLFHVYIGTPSDRDTEVLKRAIHDIKAWIMHLSSYSVTDK